MKTLLVLSVLLCASFAAPAEEKEKAPEAAVEALKEQIVAVPEIEEMMMKDGEVSVPEDAVPVPRNVVPAETLQDNDPKPSAGSNADAAAGPGARLDFCLDGWRGYRGNCYYLANHVDTWRGAESYCASYDGSLASVHNIWEHQFLQRLVQTAGHPKAWIGGYYFESDWRWDDGSVFNYHKWESAGSTNIYQCLQLNSKESKGWSNHGCSMRFPFVCQVKPSC